MIPKTIEEICELFDARIVSDIAIYQNKEQPCIYMGETKDLVAGLWGFQLTPVFFSLEALKRYCRSKKGREEINQQAATTFTDWDAENQEWSERLMEKKGE